MKQLLENWKRFITEAKVYTPEEVRSDLFPSMPDHVLGDMKREGFDEFLKDRADDIEKQGLKTILTTDEYGKGWYDRYNLNWSPEPQILDLSWEDIDAKERKFLMDKYEGKNPNFPQADQKKRYADMMQRFPNLGTGDHEPVIVKMEGGKIVDIIGGRHRAFVAFLKNDAITNPDKRIKLNAYVGT